ncbi:electron transport complex subunit RsxC [Pseudomonadota bacterium]
MFSLKEKTFPHGVHPPDHKAETNTLAIRRFPFAPVMVIPLAQHIGKPAIAAVNEGQEVMRGQVIATADGFMSVPIHAPASGVVRKIALVPSIAGTMVPGIYLEPWPGSTQEQAEGQPCTTDAEPSEIIQAIQQAGIVGLGGAAFPTHVKLVIPEDTFVDTLIINGVECEPYLTTDHRVMLEQTTDIMMGIRYLLKVVNAERAIIGVEANKADAVQQLRQAIPPDLPVTVESLTVKYPQGAEKILIKALLGRELPPGKHTIDINAASVNVATTAEIGRLLPHGRGIQERVITITGPAIEKKGNYRIPIGTPLRFALEQAGVKADVSQIFLGGPMMGQAVPNLDIAITKGTSAVLAFTEAETGIKPHVYPCIHCGACLEACPMGLNPAQLGALAKVENFPLMAAQYHLMTCFECGSCSYVCPAHIPLVHYFRLAKASLKRDAS